MPNIIGEVSLTVDGKKVVAQVCEGNYLLLPGQPAGTKGPPLSERDYQKVLDNYPQYAAELARRGETQESDKVSFTLPKKTAPESVEDGQAAAAETRQAKPPKRVPPRQEAKPAQDKASPSKGARKKMHAVVALVLVLAIALGGAAYLYTSGLLTSLLPNGNLPSSYLVCVLQNPLEPGQTIREEDIVAREITAAEYDGIRATTYIQTDPATGQAGTLSPTPILYEDRQLAIGLFLQRNYPPGTILTDRMITNQQVVADQYYADIELPDGSTQQLPLEEVPGKGMTEVEIVAIVRDESGQEIRIPLSTLVLEEKTLRDILDGQGSSILDQVEGQNQEGDVNEE